MNVRMSKLNKLANQVNKTEDKDLKRIWTNQWYKLCREYGNELMEKYEKEKIRKLENET